MDWSQNQDQAQACIKSREVLHGVLLSQKMITGTCNAFTNECATLRIWNEFMNILSEEHQLQA